MKKLRLRGDWSDTGPNSRPETEIRWAISVSILFVRCRAVLTLTFRVQFFILLLLCARLLVARIILSNSISS
jgi:hypothetical protein